ncbi:hypothetical protein REPUB_Repub01dG0174500 [Reevesia pubescens]
MNRPTLLFLSETKRKNYELVRLRMSLGFDAHFAVDYQGRSEGLALFWTHSFSVDLLSFSSSHIDTKVQILGIKETFRYIRFYCHPDTTQMRHFWNLLGQLSTANDLPWDFSTVVNDCDLIEIPVQDPFFTWSRTQNSEVVLRNSIDS